MLDDLPTTLGKDLSYLLRPDIFHPLSQINIPPGLRSEFVSPSPDDTLSSLLGILERQLADGHFLVAAHLAASILTRSSLKPTETKLIFALFYTRLACLELSGHAILAAQESKALEDLSSAFYYIDLDREKHDTGSDHVPGKPAYHIVPWPLRVLAVRLQSIGFSDPRRGIAGLYELGLEARREILRPGVAQSEKAVWKERLADLGTRSVNALIEMGDLDAARRSLDSLTAESDGVQSNQIRKALLALRIGDVDAARRIVGSMHGQGEQALKPLLSMAEGRYNDAVAEWRNLSDAKPHDIPEPLIVQNLAVCLIYTGKLNEVCHCGHVIPYPCLVHDVVMSMHANLKSSKARPLLETLVSQNHSFASLTFNLSTMYELCSDRSAKLKLELADAVAQHPSFGDRNLDRHNADFKL